MRLASLPLCLFLILLAGTIVTTAVSAPSQVTLTTPDFTMSANPDTLSIPASASGTSTITLVSIDGFNGSVSLSAPSPLCPSPYCTTWEISPSNVVVAPNSTATATLTIFAAGEGAAGNITVYVNSGGLSHSVSVAFKIVSSGRTPDFTMSANPNMLTIMQGSAGKSLIILTSINGFQGNVSLTPPVSCLAIGCPSYSVSPMRVFLSSSQNATAGFTIQTYPQTPLATYIGAVTGTSGSLSHNAPVTFTVVPSSPSDFTISANPRNQTVPAGSTAKSQNVLSSVNGFGGTISLTTSPPPLCVSCPGWTINPSSVTLSPGGTAASTLTFYTYAGSPGSTWVVSVTGTSGSLSHSVSVTFTIVPSGSTSDFSMTANPNSLIIPAGSSGTSTIVVTSLNGFNGTVNLYTSPSPLCPSLQCSHWTINPTSVDLTPNSTAKATLTIYAGTLGGSGNVTVYGTSGNLSHSVVVSFKVSQPPDFTLTVSPSSGSVSRGGSTTFAVTIQGTDGFNETVSLSASVSPLLRHGPTTSLPSRVGPYSKSTLTVSTSRSTPLGSYTITVTATSRTITHTYTVTVTVTR